MSDQEKRILSFGDRLALDRAVKALADARNALELDRAARELAGRGKPALNALLRHLDVSDPALRGGLGRLAQYLDPAETIAALRRAAMDESRSDSARLTAVMILERFLGQEIDPALAQRIPASYDIARESGEEAIAIAETEPLVLVEYAEQLLDEPPEIVQAVLQVVKDMEDPRRAKLLMAVAAYAAPAIQKDIITALGGIRDPLALQALQTLWHLVSPELRPQVQRQIQKLRMAGVNAPEPSALRTMWSPVNAQGHSFLWLIREHWDTGRSDLLTLILHDELGVVYASAYPDLDMEQLPMPSSRGAVHPVRLVDGHHEVYMVEMKTTLGLQLLDEALARHVDSQAPWPGEVVVFGHWLWAGRPLPPEPVNWPRLPAPADDVDEAGALALLEHAAFSGWVWLLPQFDALFDQQNEHEIRKNGPLHEQVIHLLLEEPNKSRLSRRLHQQALWFRLAKNMRLSARTLAVRQALDAGDESHPFIRELAWRSLITAAADRAMRRTLRLLS